MEQIEFPQDFSEFLKLLNDHSVEYLLVGGFAVAIHGYPRATFDMDVWVSRSLVNAEKIVNCLRAFGFDLPNLGVEIFMKEDQVVRMGNAPVRIEILTDIDGVIFSECVQRARTETIGGHQVPVISLDDLKTNKRASGRHKDIADLDNLP